jgi:RNA polymerase sigma-70 factor (ECF subfamily)
VWPGERPQFALDTTRRGFKRGGKVFPRSADAAFMPPVEQARLTVSSPTLSLPGGELSADTPASLSAWFAEEVQPYEQALRAYLRKRFPSLPDHDDLVQETYTRLLRARAKGRLTYAKAFLFTAARHVAIDMLRRRRASPLEPLGDEEALPLLEEPPTEEARLEHLRHLELLIEAVESLPARCRQVMMLRHLDGLAYKAIAARLGISSETVKVHMLKGVRDCHAFFRQRGLLDDLPAAAPAGRSAP